MATVSGRWNGLDPEAELPRCMRRFVWVATGMLSAATLALAFVGHFWIGAVEAAASNFVASLVAGGPFGIASLLKLGPAAM